MASPFPPKAPVVDKTQMDIPQFTTKDYLSFFSAGALCCTVTHGMMTPIDVIKTRIQIDPKLARMNMLSAGKSIVASQGPSALLTGFGPTAAGYLVQGGAKFAGYEYFKKLSCTYFGSQEACIQNRTLIYLGSASAAEFFADILLTPLEATRIRLVSTRNYASGLVPGFIRLATEEGFRGMYSGFLPILLKQVPYAIGQFATNEFVHEQVNKSLSEEAKATQSASAKWGINLGAGLVSGAAAAVISQPGDTLLSQINKGHGEGSMISRLATLSKEAGFRGLFAGLGPRIIMTMGLVSGQFLLYAKIKEMLGARPGIEIRND